MTIVLQQCGAGDSQKQGGNVNLLNYSPEAVIQAVDRQVFGREVFATQRLTVAESYFKGRDITVQEFIRQLAKSSVFRNLSWDDLCITKALGYIHRRFLSHLTLGRKETKLYYDICVNQLFYILVNLIMKCLE